MKYLHILTILASALFVSCQTTNFTDLIDYSRVSGDNAEILEKKVKLKFDRKAALIDDHDNIIKNKDVKKGTNVTVQGFVHRYIGNKKRAPHFFRENYTTDVDVWLVILPDGSRAFMEVPEMAIGVEGTNGEKVTDVKAQPNSALYLYKTTNSDKWTDDPGIEYEARQDAAVYLPVRQFKPFIGDMKYDDCTKWWSKVLYRLGGTIDFLSSHKARHLLYKDGAFYCYHPIIKMPDRVGLLVQQILSGILLFLLLVFIVPWLGVRAIWRIPFLSNGMVKIISSILAAILFIVLATFLGVEAWGYVFWILIAGFGISSYVRTTVDFNRCPYCHKIGLDFEGVHKGDWSNGKKYESQETVEVGRETREYDQYNGLGKEHVKETTIFTKTNRYINTMISRSVVTRLNCLHCHKEIKLYEVETDTVSTKVN